MARIKVAPEEGEAVYHCMTRIVNGERVIDDVGKEVLRKQLWQVTDYCGVQILTFAVLVTDLFLITRSAKLRSYDFLAFGRTGVVFCG
jgi:putative transposase